MFCNNPQSTCNTELKETIHQQLVCTMIIAAKGTTIGGNSVVCQKSDNEGDNWFIGANDDKNDETTPLLLSDIKCDMPIERSINCKTGDGITVDDLKQYMMSLPRRFCFIKCLFVNDQDNFIKKYLDILNADHRQLKYYTAGVIKVDTWVQIMGLIEIKNYYRVYRIAYNGENTGVKEIPEKKSDTYKALLVEFGRPTVCWHTVDLLIANKHITKIENFRPSCFANKNQWFWDRIIAGNVSFNDTPSEASEYLDTDASPLSAESFSL